MSETNYLLNLNLEQNFFSKKKYPQKFSSESSLKELDYTEYLKEIGPSSNVVIICNDIPSTKKLKNAESPIKELKEKEKNEENNQKINENEKNEENNQKINENYNSNLNEMNEIADLKSIQNKYCVQIQNLEAKIKEMDDEYKTEIKKYKTEIDSKEKNIQKLIITNNNLKNSLEVLTQRLDKLLINSNAQKIRNNNNNSLIISKKEQELQHKLEIKEKELKNQQHLITILTKDNKNIREKLNKFEIYNKDVDLSKIIHELYQKNMSLELKMKEYKNSLTDKKKSISVKNINSRNSYSYKNNISSNDIDNNTKSNIDQNTTNFTFKTNSFQKININKKNSVKNRSNSIESYRNWGNSGKKYVKKFFLKESEDNYKNELDVFLEKSDIVERFRGEDTIESLERLFEEDNNFFKKLVAYEKLIISKKNEMESSIRHYENELKKNKEKLKIEQNILKKKEKEIKDLNKEKELLKLEKNNLEKACINLYNNYTSLSQEYQLINEKNEENKNSVFSIEGIIEATSKDGIKIPLIKKNIKTSFKNNTIHNNNLISSQKNSSSNGEKN